jgi:hypothetical protein
MDLCFSWYYSTPFLTNSLLCATKKSIFALNSILNRWIMAYSKFTSSRVREELGIMDKYTSLFPQIVPLEPSDWLQTSLKMAKNVAFFSEKSRSEGIIFPILVELQNRNEGHFSIYSGADLEADSLRESVIL